MTNGSLLKVESIAEFSPWSILQYFLPALSDRAGNFFQSPLVPQDECHKIFTCPYVILLVLHQIATEHF